MGANYEEFAAMVHVQVKGGDRSRVAEAAEQIAEAARKVGSKPGCGIGVTAATTATFNLKGEGGAGER